MGKYMKKSKISGDVAVMDVPPQSSLGVRTRAKTLALQRLQKPPPSDESSLYYLQLRSRRLEKPPLHIQTNKRPDHPKSNSGCEESPKPPNDCGLNSRLGFGSENSVSVGNEEKGQFCGEVAIAHETEEDTDVGIEGSFGENVLEFENRDGSTRESTPCSLIRDSGAIGTPGSTTKQRMSSSTNPIINGEMRGNIPSAHQIEEFFINAEQQQQRIFIDKYNFDILSDVPLPGRYEWMQVLD